MAIIHTRNLPQIGMAWGVKDDLEKLKDTLEMIEAVTYDAEKKQANEKAVRLWLKRLRNVVYDADDVLDEFSYKAMCGAQMNKVQGFFSSSNSLSFRFKMAQKIKHINKSLDKISIEMAKFQFQISTPDSSTHVRSTAEQNLPIPSFVDESNFLGTNNNKSTIIQMLTTPQTSSSASSSINTCRRDKNSVLSIVGMGGLGKSTLAHMVYKDDSIVSSFEKRA